MTNKVDFYSNDLQTPSALIDFDRSWSSDKHKDLATQLQETFGDGFSENGLDAQFKDGDPRALTLDTQHHLTIAVHDNRVGVATSAILINNASKELVEYIRKDMAKLQPKYSKSEIFLVTGTDIFTDRVSVVSFTPLEGQDEMNYSSPYEDPNTIAQLASSIQSSATVPF